MMAKLNLSLLAGLLAAGSVVLLVACDTPISSVSANTTSKQEKPGTDVQKPASAAPVSTLSTKPKEPTASSPPKEKRSYEDFAEEEEVKPEVHTIDIPKSWTRLGKTEEIWLDKKANQVIVAGTICLDRGPLEMFICPAGTKEHESVVAVNCPSKFVHAALVGGLKANPGAPTSWDPEYSPAHGPSITVTMMWKDSKTGEVKKQNGSEWIRSMRTKKPLAHQWVFGGSVNWEDPDTKEKLYYADSGEMICLSNFSTAMIDLNIESSQANDGLVYEAFTDNIPPIGTKIYVLIEPGKTVAAQENSKAKKPSDGKKQSEAKKKSNPAASSETSNENADK